MCLRCFPPVGAKGGGGSLGSPKETTFPVEFCEEYYTLYLYTRTTIFKQKNSQENLSFQNGIISISAKIWKTTFPKEFFN